MSLIGWARELPAYEAWEVLPGARDVCYSLGMADNETPMFTAAQVFRMLADSMQYSSDAIADCDSVNDAKLILSSRANGARELADGMKPQTS